MTKRTLIVLLAGINVLLLAVLVLAHWPTPVAFAQPAPLAANYLTVAAEIKDGVDAVYVLDLGQRRLHALIPNRDQNNRRLFYADSRDLQRDFRGSP